MIEIIIVIIIIIMIMVVMMMMIFLIQCTSHHLSKWFTVYVVCQLTILTNMINNGNRTEWSPIWSVIIRVINKIR